MALEEGGSYSSKAAPRGDGPASSAGPRGSAALVASLSIAISAAAVAAAGADAAAGAPPPAPRCGAGGARSRPGGQPAKIWDRDMFAELRGARTAQPPKTWDKELEAPLPASRWARKSSNIAAAMPRSPPLSSTTALGDRERLGPSIAVPSPQNYAREATAAAALPRPSGWRAEGARTQPSQPGSSRGMRKEWGSGTRNFWCGIDRGNVVDELDEADGDEGASLWAGYGPDEAAMAGLMLAAAADAKAKLPVVSLREPVAPSMSEGNISGASNLLERQAQQQGRYHEVSDGDLSDFRAFARTVANRARLECTTANPYIQALAAHRLELEQGIFDATKDVNSLEMRLATQRHDALATLRVNPSSPTRFERHACGADWAGDAEVRLGPVPTAALVGDTAPAGAGFGLGGGESFSALWCHPERGGHPICLAGDDSSRLHFEAA